ncbi:fringe glycosyltransferase [Ischnura elegans]|uniref:fringe glycosyltransferase n=1 Tax=Ischnura elegans TaxID=197161 RepID=UPI001ED87B2D|nr:fringe glycosyltransferase [Ischnura elegans]
MLPSPSRMLGDIVVEGVSEVRASTMRTKRRAAQVALLLVATALYGAIMSSWGGAGGGGAPSAEDRWQERAPRSIAESSASQQVKPEIGDMAKGSHKGSSAVDTTTTMPPTARSTTTTLDDLFISVKTTGGFHRSRVQLVLQTWFNLAKSQTWFFTDTNDVEFQEKTGGHMVNTNCSSSHSGKALCCKMSVELDSFLESGKKWFCHVDDDNYLNVPRLVRLLSGYDPQRDWYIGKPSIRAPLEILLPQALSSGSASAKKAARKVSFWFATGGAGFCVSRALALRMLPVASGGKFISIGERIRLPDDVTMGYIIEHILGHHLTVVDEFHSHLEPMRFIPEESFPDQISFSYSRYGKEQNVLKIDKGLPVKDDPTRLLSLHCILHPSAKYCPR